MLSLALKPIYTESHDKYSHAHTHTHTHSNDKRKRRSIQSGGETQSVSIIHPEWDGQRRLDRHSTASLPPSPPHPVPES
ncbi:hypothetical protein ASPFODRAFT_587495 [Aspergillus luchuensis CBS 106.47]|uniref:Uncharacterized protein n=1 Tax=Aspergillus luchuensis (strain CBS 106.47) TaxID=1137211 RepID=A0A1M3TM80_ASPLC|nr:hypothetical protein ASPFODRAFT_587495 [Aspergillus luchuensis CBS 106.47]